MTTIESTLEDQLAWAETALIRCDYIDDTRRMIAERERVLRRIDAIKAQIKERDGAR